MAFWLKIQIKNMKIINHNTVLKYLFLNKDKCVSDPHTKDIFNYTVIDQKNVVIKYKLILYDQYSDEIGVLQAECIIEANTRLKFTDIGEYANHLSVWGRELFNKESMRFKIRMYIPRAETIAIYGNLNAA